MVDDQELLRPLEDKLQLIRDRTWGVAGGYSHGLYLHGEGGTGKTHTVENTLKETKKPYKVTNSRLSGKGLFELLRDAPDVVHVIEDAETVFRDNQTHGILRSALWGPTNAKGHQERLVTWVVSGSREEFYFTGGLIMIANRALDDVPALRAVKTRITLLYYQPSNEEIAARIRQIAAQKYRFGSYELATQETEEVAREVIARSQRVQRNLDVRLFVNTCKDRLQWANGAAITHWIDLLESRLKERVLAPTVPLAMRKTKDEEMTLARELAGLPAEQRLHVWHQKTGKSRAALYRRLADAQESHVSGETMSETG